MNQELITQIQTALAPMSEKIGQGAAFGWETVVRQQVTFGIADLLVAGIALVLFSASVFLWKKAIEEDLEPVVFFCSLILFSLFVINGVMGLMRLMNPNFYAIQFFLHLVM